MNNPLSNQNLRDVEQALYHLNEADRHIEVLKSVGEDTIDREARIAHLKQTLETIREHYAAAGKK